MIIWGQFGRCAARIAIPVYGIALTTLRQICFYQSVVSLKLLEHSGEGVEIKNSN